MLAKVSRALLEYGRLEKGPPLLVGVSGGPDSLCMLDLLHQLGFSLIVAHVDHQLRAESAQDAHLVAQAASERGLPFVSTQIDVRKYADSNALSLEEAARKARYRFLFDQARDRHAQAVLVGHTADDQVETILMHLFKGAGPAGGSALLPQCRAVCLRTRSRPGSHEASRGDPGRSGR